MGAKHRMTGSPEQRTLPGDRGGRTRASRVAKVCDVVSASVVCAASLAALVTNVAEPAKPTVESTLGPPRVSQPVRQQGTLIAVSGGTVTARSANGYTQTYLVTPNTTVVTNVGGQRATAPSRFAVNDQVDIIGTIEDGTALATAVADGGITGRGDGPPMDYLGPQEVSAVVTPAG